MGWLGGIAGGVAGGILGPIGTVGGAILGSNAQNGVSSYNQNLQNQMQNSPRPNPVDPGDIGSDQAALDQRLNNPNMSAWGKMQQQAQGLDEANSRDQAGAQADSQAAAARSNLAMRGGLSQGASERLGAQGIQSGTDAQNAVARQGMLDRLNLSAADSDRNLKATSLWAQMAAQERAQRAATLNNNYSQGMQAWAANNAANADLSGARKNGLFGLGIGGIL